MVETAFDCGGAAGVAPRSKPDGSESRPAEKAPEAETVDRDALLPADYGSRRGGAEEAKQGGASADEAQGGGRRPTGKRDRDDDPDGDRTGR